MQTDLALLVRALTTSAIQSKQKKPLVRGHILISKAWNGNHEKIYTTKTNSR